jgi:hypothetical protein
MVDIDLTATSVEEELRSISVMIERTLLKAASFFRSNLVKDFMSGKLKSLQGYDHLPFTEAEEKYESHVLFDEVEPLVKYSNGWRWIDGGSRCVIIGRKMKNCGNTGTARHPGSKLLTLFDSNNEPHVVALYAHKEKELSNPEGQGSTEVKDEYLPYVLDLAKTLDAEIRQDTKSRLLNMQQQLNIPLTSIKRLYKDVFSEYFAVDLNGKVYYSDGFYLISKEDFDKIKDLLPRKAGNIPDKLKQVLGHHNMDTIESISPKVKILKVFDLAHKIVLEKISLEHLLF